MADRRDFMRSRFGGIGGVRREIVRRFRAGETVKSLVAEFAIPEKHVSEWCLNQRRRVDAPKVQTWTPMSQWLEIETERAESVRLSRVSSA